MSLLLVGDKVESELAGGFAHRLQVRVVRVQGGGLLRLEHELHAELEAFEIHAGRGAHEAPEQLIVALEWDSTLDADPSDRCRPRCLFGSLLVSANLSWLDPSAARAAFRRGRHYR